MWTNQTIWCNLIEYSGAAERPLCRHWITSSIHSSRDRPGVRLLLIMKPPNIVMVHILSAEWSKKLFTIIHYELQNSRCIVTQELSAYIFSDNSSNFVHIVFVGSDPWVSLRAAMGTFLLSVYHNFIHNHVAYFCSDCCLYDVLWKAPECSPTNCIITFS